jgi:chaperonin cofactor prefoldin
MLFAFRNQIGELKKQNHELLERVHHLQNEGNDGDMRRHELENQLRNANTVSRTVAAAV